MAEERLIDDDLDKNKKYRIRVNEDGEEELIIDESVTEEQPRNEVLFDVEESEEEDEEAAAMTPEQLAARREREQREQLERQQKLNELLNSAESDIENAAYSTALDSLEKAGELGGEDGRRGMLYMRAYTKDFTDYSMIVNAAKSAEDVKNHADAESKRALLERAETPLEEGIAALRATVTDLNRRNEEAKAERNVRLIADRKAAIIFLVLTLVPFVLFTSLCAYFAGIIYTVSTGLYLILTIVFAVLAFVSLIALAFAARRLNITCRRMRMNRRNTSTRLGRELLGEQAKLRAYIAVLSALRD